MARTVPGAAGLRRSKHGLAPPGRELTVLQALLRCLLFPVRGGAEGLVMVLLILKPRSFLCFMLVHHKMLFWKRRF